MSTSDVVRQLVHQLDETRLQQQADQWANASMPVCRDVISTVKQVIKNRKELPASRLMALKVSPMQLFHLCMLKGNADFLLFAAKKIMSRLTILASHKKAVHDLSRGEDIFGAISLASEQNRAASAEFLRCLLSYIRIWSQRYGRMQDGSASAYAQAYMKLTNFGIMFPPREAPQASVQQRPDSVQSLPAVVFNEGSRPLSRQEIEAKSNSAQLLMEMLDSPHPDSDTAAQLHSDLSAFLMRIERELNLKTGQVGLEDYISQLFELNDFVRGALERYEKQKLNKLASGRQSLSQPPEEFKSNPPVARGQPGPGLATELEEKEATLLSLQDELAKTKREATALVQSADFRRAQCAQARAQGEQELRAMEERHAQELSARQLQPRSNGPRNRLLAINSQLADLRDKLKDKDNEHRAILKALSSAQEENKRLKATLASTYSAPLGTGVLAKGPPVNDFIAAPASPEPVYSPQDFMSQRVSLASPGLVPGDRLDTEEVLLQAVDNPTFLRLALQIDKGLVYSDSFLEVGFMFKPPQVATMLLYIGNKGDMEIRQLRSFVYGVKIEGLELGINRETEAQPIAPRSKVNRTITVSRSGVFISVPRMHLSF